MDMEGSFNEICLDVVVQAAIRFGIHPIQINWLGDMLKEMGILESTHQGYSVCASIENGCPRGGAILPLIYHMLVDRLD